MYRCSKTRRAKRRARMPMVSPRHQRICERLLTVPRLESQTARDEAPKRDHGTTRRQRPTGRSPRMEPQDEMFKSVQNWPRMWHLFRISAAKPASPSLQLNITPGRFLEEIRTLSSPSKEHHIRGPFEQTQEPARKTPQRKKARVARCAAQQ